MYSENNFLKVWNQRDFNIECNQWICIENQLSRFYFKTTLAGNELGIHNHEVREFSTYQKLKHPANWLIKKHFYLQLENQAL